MKNPITIISKQETALGFLTDEQLEIKVGKQTIRERLHVTQGMGLKIIRGNSSSNGVSLANLVLNIAAEIDINDEDCGLSNSLVIPKRFQRNFVKTIEEQQSIMQAIFQKTLTNPMYFSWVPLDKKIEIIDGQQRWITLLNFIQNKLRLGNDVLVTGTHGNQLIDISGLTYNEIKEDLPNGDQLLNNLFNNRYLPVIFYKGTEDQIRNQFRKLNTGATGLNIMELLLSNKSKLLEYVRDRNNDMDFNKVKVETNRFSAAKLMLQLFHYQKYGPSKIGKKTLEKLKDEDINTSFKNVVKILGIFIDSIPFVAKSQYGKGTTRMVGEFLSDLHSEYNLSISDSDKFFDFIDTMINSIRKQKGTIMVASGQHKYWLDENLRQDGKAYIIARTNEMNLYIDLRLGEVNGDYAKFATIAGIQLKETKRNISKTQRWEVLLNQNGICPECGQKIYLGDDAHHIELYSKGGKNEIANIVILHKTCHIKLHQNDTPT